MARYLLLYRADPEAMASMPEPTPEQAEQMNAAWNSWAQQVGAGLLDFGAPTAAVSEGAAGENGIVKRKVVPLPSPSLWTPMRPPCISTNRLTRASPRPVPCCCRA